MAFTPLLPRLLDGLFNGNRIGNPLQNAVNPLDDATPGDGDDAPSGDDFLRTLPPGIERQMQMRGLDGLPPGLARQFVPGSPPPPTDKPAPGANGPAGDVSNLPNVPGPPVPSSVPSAPQGTPTGGSGGWLTQIAAAIASAFAQRPGPSQPSTAPTRNDGAPGNPNAAQRANGVPGTAATVQAATVPSSLNATPAQVASPAFPASPTLQATQAAQLALAQASPPVLRAFGAAAAPVSAVPAGTTAAATPSPPGMTSQAAAPTAARAPDSLAQARTDVVPPSARAEQSVLDRLAGLLRPGGEMARIVLPAVVAREAAQAAAAQAANAMGSTTGPAPLTAPPPQTLGDARPMGVTGNERAGMARSDVVMTPAFTGTGPARRGGRLDAFQSRLRRGRDALHAEGDITATRRDDARADKEGWFALQWMFWVLAIVAYGCLALALIAFLPATSALSIDIDRVHPWASTIVLLTGLATAVAAWWLARRLMRT